MDIFGDSKDKGEKLKGGMIKGDFETLQKMRKETMKEFEATIKEVFKDYDGEMIAIVRIREDENGDPEGHQECVLGVGSVESRYKLSRALQKVSNDTKNELMESCKVEPRAMVALAKAVANDMLSETEEEK